MNNDPDKQHLTDLAWHLAAATAARAAQWQLETDDVFRWDAKEGSVTVASRDRDGEPPYELSVYSPAREKVDELLSELLPNDQPAPWNEPLVEVYRVARRSALRADEIIDALIAALPTSGASGDDKPEGRSLLTRAKAYSSSGSESDS
jgi:hypothetical protein